MKLPPSVSHSENLPSWQLKREKASVNQNLGPALTVSVNTTDPMPCLENNEENEVFQVGCVESRAIGIGPLAQSHPVIAQSAPPLLEDGKKLETVESSCIQNSPQAGTPGAAAHEVFRPEVGDVLENVKMVKGLT